MDLISIANCLLSRYFVSVEDIDDAVEKVKDLLRPLFGSIEDVWQEVEKVINTFVMERRNMLADRQQ